MKKIQLLIFSLCILLSGCAESEVPLYSGTDGIYFNNRTTGQMLVDSTAFSFIYYDIDSTDVVVKVQTYGRVRDYDRPFCILVESDDAREGVDYRLCSEPVIPAGESHLEYMVRLYKTSVLNDREQHLRFTLLSNDCFGTNYPLSSSADKETLGTDALHYRIAFSNQYTVPPRGWQTMFGGTFKPEKLDLLVLLFPEVPRQAYNEPGAITFAKWSYMQQTTQNYINQQIQFYMMGALYDPHIFDRNGEVLDFRN